jgi:hypothetical protein
MTCIVGIADGTNVWLGADNAGSDDDGTLYLSKLPKIWRHGGLVFGTSGSRRIAQLLKYSLECPPCQEGQNVEVYVTRVVVGAIRDCLRDGGRITVKDGIESMDAWVLVGVQGRLFEIDGEFGANESPEGYASIGIGAPEARGALYGLVKMWLPYVHPGNERILLDTAMQCSERFNTCVRGPFAYVSTLEK